MVNKFVEALFNKVWNTVIWIYNNNEFQLENYISNTKYKINHKERDMLYKKFCYSIKENLLPFVSIAGYINIFPNEINNLINKFIFGENYHTKILNDWSEIPNSMWDFRVTKYPFSQTRSYFLYQVKLEEKINIPRTNLLRINKMLCEIGECETYKNGYEIWKKINQKKRSWMKKAWLEDRELSFVNI